MATSVPALGRPLRIARLAVGLAARAALGSVNHPIRTGVAVVLLTLVFALQIPRLEVDGSNENLMAVNDPARGHYDLFVRAFGHDLVTLVVIKADDVFSEHVLRVIQRLSDALARHEDVSRVESLTTVQNIRGDADTLTTEPLVGATIPDDPRVLARIRRDALANRVLVGNLVSAEARATVIAAYTAVRPRDTDFAQRFSREVDAMIAREAGPGLVLYQFGDPAVIAAVADQIRRDFLTFIPLSMGVLILFLLIVFRMLQGLLIPATTGVLGVIWSLGLMALLGLPLNVLTVIVPALLIVIGSAEDVHMLTEYHRLLREGHPKREALHLMIQRTMTPILVTTGTTVVGFASVALSPIPAQVHFGYASAIGLIASFFVTILTLPLLLRVLPIPGRLRPSALDVRAGDLLPRLMQWLARFNRRHRVAISAVAGLLLVASLGGWWTLRVDSDQLAFFPADAPIRQRAEDFQRSLTGFAVFSVVVDSGADDGLKEPDLLRRIVALQDYLASLDEVDGTLGVTDYLRTLHREMNGGDPRFERIPDTPAEVAQYLLTLEGRELSRYIDFRASSANIVVRTHVTSTWQLSTVLDRLRAYVSTNFPPSVQIHATGRIVLLRNAADSIAINELVSLTTTFAIIALVHALFFMSIRIGLLSLIPNAVPVLLVYGLMGILAIPLNLATALIATIAIGIAVDDTVHHMVTYRRELAAHGDRTRAMNNTMRSQAPPIIYVSVALAAGFFVFGFSTLLPAVHFGILSGLVMLIAMVGELVLTPIVMYTFAPSHVAWQRAASGAPQPSATTPHP